MKNILILGAHGRIARIVEQRLLAETDAHLTLVLRHAERLTTTNLDREAIVEGDASDPTLLATLMPQQDLVYANLAGNMTLLAKTITTAMLKFHVADLVWITGSGLYHETPEPFGSWVEQVVGHASKEDTRQAARIIEGSPLHYTIIRAAYMTDDPQIDYELTQKGETFKGTLVSRASIADLVVKILAQPQQYARQSLGIAQPGTDDSLPQIKIMEKHR